MFFRFLHSNSLFGNCNVRAVQWTDRGEWTHPDQCAMKTLTDMTQYTDYIEARGDCRVSTAYIICKALGRTLDDFYTED